MPKISPHPYVTWRDGRPRFTPSPELRKLGHQSRDLRHDDGRWFTKGEAVDWSAAFRKELAATAAKVKNRARAIAAPLVVAAHRRRAPSLGVTVGQLYQDWQHPLHGSIRFRAAPVKAAQQPAAIPVRGRRNPNRGQEKSAYAARTLQDIREKISLIETDHADIWASPADALTQPVMFGLYEELVAARGLGQARGAIAWLSVMFSWGRKRGKLTFALNQGQNPAQGLGMVTPPPRVRFGTRDEINALIAAADKLGMPEIGDMIVLGVWTGQRQADRLQLVDKGLLNNRRIFRQNKTGAIVAIRESPELTARLKASAERRKAAGIVSPHVILDEQRWEPFAEFGDRYRKRFALVRAAAGKSTPTLLGKGREDGVPFFEADLRDTSVTWQALAGATIPEICAITGHQLQSATRILRHYLARHPEMGDVAIAKMIEWYEGDGETEIGI